MSELRQNPLSGQWVVYSPSRKKRPYDFRGHKGKTSTLPAHDTNCPFCPGNEHLLPGIIMEKKDGKGVSWHVRVVPNKYTAFEPAGPSDNTETGPYGKIPGYGYHEVIIESPVHNDDISRMTHERVTAIVETYHKRYCAIVKDERIKGIFIFKNHGKAAGTSLLHPHSQIIGTPVVPTGIEIQKTRAGDYFRSNRHCLFCDILDFERTAGTRLVLENSAFVTFVPYAAEVPFELWIFPKIHQPDFRFANDEQMEELAAMLKTVIGMLSERLGDPDYNLLVGTFTGSERNDPTLHWHIVIRPRTTIKAGFEIGSGMAINPSLPEDDRRALAENIKRSG